MSRYPRASQFDGRAMIAAEIRSNEDQYPAPPRLVSEPAPDASEHGRPRAAAKPIHVTGPHRNETPPIGKIGGVRTWGKNEDLHHDQSRSKLAQRRPSAFNEVQD